MSTDLLYLIALTQIPYIGSVHAKSLLSVYGNAENIFRAPRHHLEKMEGIGTVRAQSIKKFREFDVCEKELCFIEKNRITTLSMFDDHYPRRLLNCYDNPVLLFYKGSVDLNASKIISVVGTRNHTEYGKHICEQFITELKDQHILVVSGLAFGIDTLSHRCAVKNSIPTIGVLAHGLDRIYPKENRNLAKQMITDGGLLTEFISGSDPDRENFPKRNRIVAGMCDAVVVVETRKKGGSIITAEIANGYNKDVFAFPGRTTDPKSEGCNHLIRNNKAMLLTDSDHFLEIMQWKPVTKKKKQAELFITLSKEEQTILDLFKDQEAIHIDEIHHRAQLSGSHAASALLMLEMNGILSCLPGKIYRLNS